MKKEALIFNIGVGHGITNLFVGFQLNLFFGHKYYCPFVLILLYHSLCVFCVKREYAVLFYVINHVDIWADLVYNIPKWRKKVRI